MASFGAALTHVLLNGGTATADHLNNPVHAAASKLVGSDLAVPIRRFNDGSQPDDVWETFSDLDYRAGSWVQLDGSEIPTPPEGSFGWAFDAMRATPGEAYRPEDVPKMPSCVFDGNNFRWILPTGEVLFPLFPARVMRGRWMKV